MTKKLKIKKWLKDHFTKENIFKWFLIIAIALIMFFIAYYQNKDIDNMNNKENNINIVDDDINLNKDYYINNDGNLVSDNLLAYEFLDGKSINTNGYFVNSSFNYYGMPFDTFINIDSSYYSVSLESTYGSLMNCIFGEFNNDTFLSRNVIPLNYSNGIYSASYTPSSNVTKVYIYFWINDTSLVLSDYVSNIMFSLGSTYLPYEPYGIWYSQQNYNVYGSQQYSIGYDVGYDEGIEYADTHINIESVSYESGYNAGITYADGRVNRWSASFTTGYYEGVDAADARVNTESASYESGYNAGITYADGRVNTSSASYTTGYNTGYDVGYDEGFDDGLIDPSHTIYTTLYNIFSNSVAKLYNNETDELLFTESISLGVDDVSISMSNFPTINNYLNGYDSEDTTTYPTQYFYMILDLNTSTNSPLVFSLNNAILDTDIKLYYNDLMLSTYTRDTDPYHIYVNQESNYTYNRIYYDTFYAPDYISLDFNISTSGLVYTNGYKNGVESMQYEVDTLQYQLNNAISQQELKYNEGYQVGYNEGSLEDISTNGFKTLCNSILSYPVNLLSSVFNFNFMGINIASTIFFLISVGIVLWIIKRLWK